MHWSHMISLPMTFLLHGDGGWKPEARARGDEKSFKAEGNEEGRKMKMKTSSYLYLTLTAPLPHSLLSSNLSILISPRFKNVSLLLRFSPGTKFTIPSASAQFIIYLIIHFLKQRFPRFSLALSSELEIF